jgi:hypothetical protein
LEVQGKLSVHGVWHSPTPVGAEFLVYATEAPNNSVHFDGFLRGLGRQTVWVKELRNLYVIVSPSLGTEDGKGKPK